MLEIRDYSRAELIELFGTNRLDAIKAKVERQGYSYENIGRGQNYVMRIISIPQDDLLKRYCIDKLGIDANTDFKKFRYFLYNYLTNEDFVTLQLGEMREELKRQGINVADKTLSKYYQTTKRLGWTTQTGIDYVYYVYDKNIKHNRYITKQEYTDMYSNYWNTVRKDRSFERADYEIKAKYGSKPKKRQKDIVNGIYRTQYDELLELM